MSLRRFASSAGVGCGLVAIFAVSVVGQLRAQGSKPAASPRPEVPLRVDTPPRLEQTPRVNVSPEVATPALSVPTAPAVPGVPPPATVQNLADVISTSVRAVTDKAGPAICRVETEDEQGRLSGTGFFIDSDGTLVTSYTLGNASEDLVVTLGDEKFPARRLVADGRSGISLVKVDTTEPLPFIKSGDPRALTVGTPVIALGYPLQLPLSHSFGTVAGFDSGFQGRLFATRHIRANAVIQRGEGGAPLLSLDGAAVGVLISGVEGSNGLFALPIDAVEKVLHDYRNHRRLRPGWLGADVRITDAPEHGSTARLRVLNSKGPGARELRPGDVLLQIGSWKITCPEDVLNASFYVTASEPVEVRVSRAGKVHTYTIVPMDPPEGEVLKVLRQDPGTAGATSDLKLGP